MSTVIRSYHTALEKKEVIYSINRHITGKSDLNQSQILAVAIAASVYRRISRTGESCVFKFSDHEGPSSEKLYQAQSI